MLLSSIGILHRSMRAHVCPLPCTPPTALPTSCRTKSMCMSYRSSAAEVIWLTSCPRRMASSLKLRRPPSCAAYCSFWWTAMSVVSATVTSSQTSAQHAAPVPAGAAAAPRQNASACLHAGQSQGGAACLSCRYTPHTTKSGTHAPVSMFACSAKLDSYFSSPAQHTQSTHKVTHGPIHASAAAAAVTCATVLLCVLSSQLCAAQPVPQHRAPARPCTPSW